jgi:hypothetical protein
VTLAGLALLEEKRPHSHDEQHRQGGNESRPTNSSARSSA